MAKWTVEHDMPVQDGRVAIVTGANSGLGYETSMALALKGAHVVMACRNTEKGISARDEIAKRVPKASLEVMALDLGSLESVKSFADAFRAAHDRLDLLINNAGVMALPRGETVDGFEQQFGVNHLGHFALTGHLIDMLIATSGSRIVNVTSSAGFYGQMDFDDLQGEKAYSRYGAYGQSKLANMLFTQELQRRLERAGVDTISAVAHPGLAETNLQATTSEASGAIWERVTYTVMHAVFSQDGAMGALPQLYAATAPEVKGGDFYGPVIFQMRGYPKRTKLPKAARSKGDAERLWQVSKELTGVTFDALEQVAPANVG